MEHIKYLIFILVTLSLHSCYVIHNQLAEEFSYCYDGTKTSIDTLININGYYECEYLTEKGYVDRKQILIFYENGIFIKSDGFEILKPPKGVDKPDFYNKNCDVGIYKVIGDTIKIQYIYIGSATSGCEAIHYKVLDNETIKWVFYSKCDCLEKKFPIIHNVTDAKFVPSKNLPNPYFGKVFKRKWFWCDEKEFKKWKRRKK